MRPRRVSSSATSFVTSRRDTERMCMMSAQRLRPMMTHQTHMEWLLGRCNSGDSVAGELPGIDEKDYLHNLPDESGMMCMQAANAHVL